MKTRFLPVALAAVALTLTACGGSGAPSQPKGPISEDRTAAFKSMMPEFTPHGQNGQRRRTLRRRKNLNKPPQPSPKTAKTVHPV